MALFHAIFVVIMNNITVFVGNLLYEDNEIKYINSAGVQTVPDSSLSSALQPSTAWKQEDILSIRQHLHTMAGTCVNDFNEAYHAFDLPLPAKDSWYAKTLRKVENILLITLLAILSFFATINPVPIVWFPTTHMPSVEHEVPEPLDLESQTTAPLTAPFLQPAPRTFRSARKLKSHRHTWTNYGTFTNIPIWTPLENYLSVLKSSSGAATVM